MSNLSSPMQPHYLFAHVATLGRYQLILDELAEVLSRAELGRTAAGVILGVVGTGPVSFHPAGVPVQIHRWSEDVQVFEHPTLLALQSAASQAPEAAFLYFNCLGGRHEGVGWSTRQQWRRMLYYLLFSRYVDCLERLASHDALGVSFLQAPLPHFTSNNWWASGRYLARLQSPIQYREGLMTRDLSAYGETWNSASMKARHSGEFWIGSDPSIRPFSVLDIRALGLPNTFMGSVPWWGIPGIDWEYVARSRISFERVRSAEARFRIARTIASLRARLAQWTRST